MEQGAGDWQLVPIKIMGRYQSCHVDIERAQSNTKQVVIINLQKSDALGTSIWKHYSALHSMVILFQICILVSPACLSASYEQEQWEPLHLSYKWAPRLVNFPICVSLIFVCRHTYCNLMYRTPHLFIQSYELTSPTKGSRHILSEYLVRNVSVKNLTFPAVNTHHLRVLHSRHLLFGSYIFQNPW